MSGSNNRFLRDLFRAGVKKLFVKPPPARPGEVNFPFVDRFTFIHFGIGVGYKLFGLGYPVALALALAWEFFENPLKVYFPFVFPHATADTWENMTGDVLAVSLGWLTSDLLLKALL